MDKQVRSGPDVSSSTAEANNLTVTPGKRTLVESTYPAQVQQRVAHAGAQDDAAVHGAASRGLATPSSSLPYADRIQRLFGRHDISGIQAHTGPEAMASARAMGAEAYATGHHVVLGGKADLHTVAHEAAHVVQQRGGIQLKGGVGEVGDVYEQHADDVAHAVVQGRSAEGLLDQHVPRSGGAVSVQRKCTFADDITNEAKQVLQRVLAVNPVLDSMWRWVDAHQEIILDVTVNVTTGQSAAVQAKLGSKNITLKIRPDKAVENGGIELLETLSHELTLHMLPWARPLMDEELRVRPDAIGPAQRDLINAVLAPIRGADNKLEKQLAADNANKGPTTLPGGNHSDIGLWALHLSNMLGLVKQEPDDRVKLALITTTVHKVNGSMLLTGSPADVVDRGPEVFDDVLSQMAAIGEYESKIHDSSSLGQFRSDFDRILNRVLECKEAIVGMSNQSQETEKPRRRKKHDKREKRKEGEPRAKRKHGEKREKRKDGQKREKRIKGEGREAVEGREVNEGREGREVNEQREGRDEGEKGETNRVGSDS